MSHALETPKISQVKFVGKIYILKENTDKKNTALILHVLGYKEKNNANFQAVCLELGVFVDGKTEASIFKNLKKIINDVIAQYSTKELTHLIKSTSLETYWALYREYAHKHSEENIKTILGNIEKEKVMRELIETQQEQIEKLQEKIASLEPAGRLSDSKKSPKSSFIDFIIDEPRRHMKQAIK